MRKSNYYDKNTRNDSNRRAIFVDDNDNTPITVNDNEDSTSSSSSSSSNSNSASVYNNTFRIHFNMMFDDKNEPNDIDAYLGEIKKLEIKEKQYAHPLLVQVEINGISQNALLDHGATRNLCRKSLINKLYPDIYHEPLPFGAWLISSSEHRMPIKSRVLIHVNISNDEYVDTLMYVVTDTNDMDMVTGFVLGRTFLSATKLCYDYTQDIFYNKNDRSKRYINVVNGKFITVEQGGKRVTEIVPAGSTSELEHDNNFDLMNVHMNTETIFMNDEYEYNDININNNNVTENSEIISKNNITKNNISESNNDMSDERNITDRGLETCGKSEINNTLNTHIDNEIKIDLNNNNININNKNINNKNNVKNYVNNKDKNTKSHKQKCEERQIKKKILYDKRQSIISEFNSLIYGEKGTHLTDTMKDLCMNHIRANVDQYDLVN